MEYTENTAVGCVIMASGRAVRFGSNKLLADFGGAPLIVRALDAAETPALALRVVVTRSPEVAELACKAGVKTILHSLPGRNDTVRLGLETLLSELPGLAGCIFLPGDQPLLRKESLEAMARDFSALDEKERAILRLGLSCRGRHGAAGKSRSVRKQLFRRSVFPARGQGRRRGHPPASGVCAGGICGTAGRAGRCRYRRRAGATAKTFVNALPQKSGPGSSCKLHAGAAYYNDWSTLAQTSVLK